MESNDLLKLKSSLCDAIQAWIDKEAGKNVWPAIDTSISDHTAELMADSAFNILLAQKDLTEYYNTNNMLKP